MHICTGFAGIRTMSGNMQLLLLAAETIPFEFFLLLPKYTISLTQFRRSTRSYIAEDRTLDDRWISQDYTAICSRRQNLLFSLNFTGLHRFISQKTELLMFFFNFTGLHVVASQKTDLLLFVEFHRTTRRYIPWHRTLHSPFFENFKFPTSVE